jgi:predicted TIM-barrel fold metal-dependent hydrolase
VSNRRPGAVDVHLHLSEWWRDIRRTGYRTDLDYSVRGLLAEMDGAGIEQGVVIQLHEAPTVRQGLEEGRRIVVEGGGRLRAVTTVDPTLGEGELRTAIDLWEGDPDLAGIKLYPGYRAFYPHDRRLDPVYEYAHRRDLPVMIHQGDTLDGLGLVKYARPIEVDEVAGRYRDVRFVLCHLGNPWVNEGAELVYKNENVYADTSGLLAHPSSPYFDRMLRQVREVVYSALVTVGRPDRFLYGSDWPLEELRVAVGVIDELDLPERDRDAILGGNARRLFGLGSSGPRSAPS